MIEAPWTDEQVALFNRWQATPHFHGLTCPNDHDVRSRLLIARTDGWRCPSCFYQQTWTPDFMAYEPLPFPLKESMP